MKSKIVLYFTLGFIGLLFLVNLVHGDSLFTGKIDQLPKDTHVYNLRIEHNIMGNIKIVTSDDSDSQDIQVEAVADQELYEKAISIEHIPDPRFPHRSGTLCVNITDAHDEGGEVMPSMASRSFSPSIWAPIISVLSLNYFQGNSGTALSLAAAAIASFSMFSAQEAQALEEFKVDVTVYVPQNLKLNIIDINIRNGTIEIDDSIAYYPMCAVGDSDLCPFCCSGNGKCTDTGCQCSPEFQGEDCSQEKPHHVLENTNGLPQKFEVLQYEEYRGEMYILTDRKSVV